MAQLEVLVRSRDLREPFVVEVTEVTSVRFRLSRRWRVPECVVDSRGLVVDPDLVFEESGLILTAVFFTPFTGRFIFR